MWGTLAFIFTIFLPGCGQWIGLAKQSALHPTAKQALEVPITANKSHPPIPVRFTLKKPGFVTLVIEDQHGKRVRNLISETPFPAGANVVYWDGLDDIGRDPNAAAHGVYHIPGKLVAPGTYRVNGLIRPQIDLRYEMTAYTNGNPPWSTADNSGEWLANHTAPSAVLFVPQGAAPKRSVPGGAAPGGQVLVGSEVSEGGSGLAWLDLNGRKLHGQLWVGGVWTGAKLLARDDGRLPASGSKPLPGVYAYTGAVSDNELRLHQLVIATHKTDAPSDNRLGTGEDRPVVTPNFKFPDKNSAALSGLAVNNSLLVASLPKLKQLLFVDAAAQKVLGTVPLSDPRGLAFDRQGRLLALSGRQLLRFEPGTNPVQLSALQVSNAVIGSSLVIVAQGLEDPQQMTLDAFGNIYISDRGSSHQVKVFSPEGKFLRAIGDAGKPKVGPYNPNHMHNPNGITISSDGHLWVAETDKTPKRLSVWTLDGKLYKAFYGPSQYGGGGWLDPLDKTRFFYADEGGMELKLDWEKGTSEPVSLYYRPELDTLSLPKTSEGRPPETPIHLNGQTYLTDAYNTSPTNGTSSAAIWLLRHGVAVPVAAIGQANDWNMFGAKEAFIARLPAGANLSKDRVLFAWSDLNGNGKVEPDEVTTALGDTLSVNVMPDLSIVTGTAMLFKPQRFTSHGAPIYDATKKTTLVPDTQVPTTSGGGQALHSKDNWTVLSVAPKPYAPQSMGGAYQGQAMWSYPSVWPGLHASHIAPMPDRLGELIGTTRLLGTTVTPRGSDAGEIWAILGNKGNVYLFTTDGLFVATLFKDSRSASWSNIPAQRDMRLNDVSIGEESFWPSITQTTDGRIYLVAGNSSSIVRVEGLEGIQRLPARSLQVTPEILQAAQADFVQTETQRQHTQGPNTLRVAILQTPPTVDGKLDDWGGANWVTINTRMTQTGDWGSQEAKTQAAIAISGDRLYAAFKTDDPNLLNNSGETLQNLFKTGGALDLMLGTDANADPKRNRALPGDLRLLVTQVKGKTVAMLYRPVVPGTTTQQVSFSSPLRTLKFDRVDDVSAQVVLANVAQTKPEKTISGNYEFSIPLAVLGLKPAAFQVIRGDVGILSGNGFQTLQRVYWSNKASGLTSDVPSEAELTPQLWGKWEFKPAQ